MPAIRIDAMSPEVAPTPIATLVGFACHPVVVGPEVPMVGSDFVGPLRDLLDELRGGVTVFLQGAAGNVLPLEGFQEHPAAARPFGERLALEAARAIADAEPRRMTVDRLDYGSVTPIRLYRRRVAASQPGQTLPTARRIVRLPLLPSPTRVDLEAELEGRRLELDRRERDGQTRVTTNPVRYHIAWLERRLVDLASGPLAREVEGEVWTARLGEQAIVGGPGEIFGELGHTVRRASPAAVTIFAGYSNGSLGYIPTRAEYPYGGYETAVSHRGYDLPAPFAPGAGELVRDAAIELLEEIFTAP